MLCESDSSVDPCNARVCICVAQARPFVGLERRTTYRFELRLIAPSEITKLHLDPLPTFLGQVSHQGLFQASPQAPSLVPVRRGPVKHVLRAAIRTSRLACSHHI